MSTRYEILTEKARHTEHVATHRCGYRPCTVRTALWLKYQACAARWGIEPGDDTRQRDQYLTMHAA